ncbi:unnamed protein product [Cyprideis torosa]|uniref:Sulfotransferase domain-containing protein n=1 Tax=Cyprideis torosa TaxID=163714 RepID=A0A7R8W870_9CRUS|nr:unnamed protein product [Cyprideis torosa]CAG0883149.1 unnamed protein product [Cyprideis torosa]
MPIAQLLQIQNHKSVVAHIFGYIAVSSTLCRIGIQRHVLVTHSSQGIGKQTALQLAQRGARVILACRSRERGEAAVGEISEKLRNVEDPGCVLFRQLDLASFKSIRQFAEQILSTEKQLHVLINNAGLAGLNERMKTEDGLEYEMGVNYFGHFYLTELLMDLLKKSAPSRIINVSSSWHWGGTLDPQNLNCEKHFQRDVLLSVFPVKQYVNSKLAQVSHTRQLARRLEGTGVSCYSLHPGWVASDAFRHVIWIFQPFVLTVTKLLAWNTDEGAQTSIFLAAVDKVPGKSGDFFFNCAVSCDDGYDGLKGFNQRILEELMSEGYQPLFNATSSESNRNKTRSSVWRKAGIAVTIAIVCVVVFAGYNLSCPNQKWDLNAISERFRFGYEDEDDGFRARRFPDAIIIGVRKGGTRALLEMLNLHPKVRKVGPEVHFFDHHYERGYDWYLSQMPQILKSEICIEKTPAYFVTPSSPELIYHMTRTKGNYSEANPLKLLLIVRDPVERLISDYSQRISTHPEHRTFEELVFDENGLVNEAYKAVRISLYAKHFRRWLEYFNRSHIHIVDGDLLITDPLSEIRKAERFLKLTPYFNHRNFFFNDTKGFYCLQNEVSRKCLARSKGRKHPKVDPFTITKLRRYFSKWNHEFEDLTDLRFDWPDN